MISADPHKVGRVRVRCASVLGANLSGAAEEACGKGDALAKLCREHLPALLQEIFDEMAPSDDPRVVSFDSLRLNLGSLTANEFIPRLREAMRKELRARPAVPSDAAVRFFSLFAAYLEKGVVPWNALDFTPARWSAAVGALLDDADRRKELFALVRGRDLPLRRLRYFLQGLGIQRHDIEQELCEIAENTVTGAAGMPAAFPAEVHINNAGLVLLAPFLSRFFQRLELLDACKGFLDAKAQSAAAWMLHRVIAPGQALTEGEMPLNKLLCGLPPCEPVPPPTPEALAAAGAEALLMLRSVIGHWKGLGAVEPETFIQDFLLRGGVLRLGSEAHLHVEAKAHDAALYTLPWALSIIQTPWMDTPLMVHWSCFLSVVRTPWMSETLEVD